MAYCWCSHSDTFIPKHQSQCKLLSFAFS